MWRFSPLRSNDELLQLYGPNRPATIVAQLVVATLKASTPGEFDIEVDDNLDI
jgi:hypothetical protein